MHVHMHKKGMKTGLILTPFFKSGSEEVMFIHTHYNHLNEIMSAAEEPAPIDKLKRLDSVFGSCMVFLYKSFNKDLETFFSLTCFDML